MVLVVLLLSMRMLMMPIDRGQSQEGEMADSGPRTAWLGMNRGGVGRSGAGVSGLVGSKLRLRQPQSSLRCYDYPYDSDSDYNY